MLQEMGRWVVRSIRHYGWAPITVFLAHVLATKVFGGYEKWPPLDIPMHVLGGIAMALFLWGAFSRPELPKLFQPHTLAMRVLVVFGWVGTSTVVWELAEWLVGWLRPANMQTGLEDTMLDMFLGLLGGGIYLAHAYWRQ